MHLGKKRKVLHMSEKSCVGRNGIGGALEMGLGRRSGQRGLSGQQGKLLEGFLQKSGSMPRLELQPPTPHPQKAHSEPFKGLPEFSPSACGFTLSSSPLSLFRFLFNPHLSLSLTDLKGSGEKCKTANFTPLPDSSKIFIVFYILSSIITFSFLIW